MTEKNISNKQVSVNMISNIVSYSVNLIVAFILTPFLIEQLGKETYSFYPMANTIANYMAILMTAMNSIASRFVTISIVQKDENEANKYFSSTLIANAIMCGIVAIPMVIIVCFIDLFMDVPINSIAAIRVLFTLVFASSLVHILATVFGIATFTKNRIDLRSARELVVAIAKLALYYLLYQFLPPSIIYVGIVIFVVGVLNFVIQVYYTRKLLPEIKVSLKYVSLKHTKQLLASSCWTAINSVGNQLLVGMMLILANLFYGASASGVYSIVNTVPQFLSGMIAMLVGVFYPVIMNSYARGDMNSLLLSIGKSQNIVGIFGCSVAVVFAALSKEFFILWTPNENAEALSRLTMIIIAPYFFIACMWTIVNVNIIMNKVRIPALITLVIGCSNIVLSNLVYRLGCMGTESLAVISTVLQIFWIGFCIPKYICKNLSLKWWTFHLPLFRALPCSFIVFGLINLIKPYFPITSNWFFFIMFGGVAGVFTLAVHVIGMFGVKTLLDKYKNRT